MYLKNIIRGGVRMDFYEDQIDCRKRSDKELFENAFSDLLSILGINTPRAKHETKNAISEILKYFGFNAPEVPDNITNLDSELEYMLRPSGTMRRRVELKGKWWEDCTGCFLGSTKEGNVIAILPGKWSGYYYKDSLGNVIKVNDKTSKDINVDAFCFYKPFPLKSLRIRDLIKFIISSTSYQDIVIILSAMLLGQILGFLGPYITNIIYNILIPSGTMSFIVPVISLYLGMSVGKFAILVTNNIVKYRFRSRMSLAVNSAIMMRLFSLPPTFFKNYTAGELASRMSYISSMCTMIVESCLSTGIAAFFSLGYIFQMYYYAPGLVMPGMIVILTTICYLIFITFYRQRVYKKKIQISPKLQALTYALFGGMQKIKVTGSEKRAFAKWAQLYSDVERLDYNPPLILKLDSAITLIISSLGTIAIYYFAIKTSVDSANYFSFNTAYGAVSAALTSLSGVALKFANFGPILSLIKPVLEEKPEISVDRKIPTSLSGEIDVNHVTFRYSKNGPKILDDINFKIKRGEYIGIVGKTGCGKSTLMRVLLGFESPEQGAVYYGGKDLKNLDLRSVRQKIGVVMQNGTLFPGDIFSNIIITSPWKNLDDAWEAAEMAGIAEDIKMMPMGMHTLISEGAGGLSGGQRQRLMIARAIIAKPSVLFFDEATSALDNITQSHVSNSISELKSTRLVIAHRLSTIKNCDRIFVMDKGKIVEQGTYDDLMSKKGDFYDLAIRQIVG